MKRKTKTKTKEGGGETETNRETKGRQIGIDKQIDRDREAGRQRQIDILRVGQVGRGSDIMKFYITMFCPPEDLNQ